MNEIKLNITIKHYQLDELSADDRELVERAVQATYNAYAEYSHFYVGAAVRLADGSIVIGANQRTLLSRQDCARSEQPSLLPKPTIPTRASRR